MCTSLDEVEDMQTTDDAVVLLDEKTCTGDHANICCTEVHITA